MDCYHYDCRMRESAASSRYRHRIILGYRLIAIDGRVARTRNSTGSESTPGAVGIESYSSAETIESGYLDCKICNNTSIDSNARRTGGQSEVLDGVRDIRAVRQRPIRNSYSDANNSPEGKVARERGAPRTRDACRGNIA